MRRVLTKRQLDNFLKQHPSWTTNKKRTELSRLVHLSSYLDGLIVIARIAVYAEMMGHHPDIVFKSNSLKITLTTRDIKGVSTLDTTLAGTIDDLCS